MPDDCNRMRQETGKAGVQFHAQLTHQRGPVGAIDDPDEAVGRAPAAHLGEGAGTSGVNVASIAHDPCKGEPLGKIPVMRGAVVQVLL